METVCKPPPVHTHAGLTARVHSSNPTFACSIGSRVNASTLLRNYTWWGKYLSVFSLRRRFLHVYKNSWTPASLVTFYECRKPPNPGYTGKRIFLKTNFVNLLSWGIRLGSIDCDHTACNQLGQRTFGCEKLRALYKLKMLPGRLVDQEFDLFFSSSHMSFPAQIKL